MDSNLPGPNGNRRTKLTAFQLNLLNEFWDHYLATGEWPKMRATHSRHQKSKTQAALGPLGSHLVGQVQDHNQGDRYSLTASAVLLTRHGGDYRRLLLRYLEFLRRLFLEQPEKLQVTDAEVALALKLTPEETGILGSLLQLRPFYDRAGGPDSWTARCRPEVEDFPPTGALDASLDAIFERDREHSEPVFAEKRQAFSADLSLASFFEPRATSPAVHIDALKRRYQVFVSSTYDDLKDERRHVMQALLETKCIPTGMEMFPAASIEQWKLIKRVIDECDYYIVIVAGRYGTIGKAGNSYTEQEFDYAIKIGKPVIGFYHRDLSTLPGSKLQPGDEARAKLAAFANKVKERLCRAWSTPEELGSAVKSAILNELEFNPRPGWIRADAVPASEGVEKLKQRIADLEERLKHSGREVQIRPPRPRDQGGDQVSITVEASYILKGNTAKTSKSIDEQFLLRRTWDQLLLLFSDHLKDRMEIQTLRKPLEEALAKEVAVTVTQRTGVKPSWVSCTVDEEFFDRLIHTLAARKLVRLDLPRSSWGRREMEIRLATAGIARVAELKAL